MKLIAGLIFADAALAQTPVTLSIDTQAAGLAIPADFSGLSFETETLMAWQCWAGVTVAKQGFLALR
jgi:hypothetical protein